VERRKTYTLKQRIIGIIIIAAIVLPLTIVIAVVKDGRLWAADSPEAEKLKAMMTPIAEKLDEAEKIGGIVDLNDLLDRQIVMSNYASEVLAQKNSDSPFVYCHRAMLNLSNGFLREIMSVGRWPSRDQYKAALSKCK
jgi:hypothetical protein